MKRGDDKNSERPSAAAPSGGSMKRGHIIGACALALALISLIVGLLVGRKNLNVSDGREFL